MAPTGTPRTVRRSVFGHFPGGALLFEEAHPTGTRFEQQDVWHGPLNSRDYTHWNEEILPVDDTPPTKYAVVAYAHEGFARTRPPRRRNLRAHLADGSRVAASRKTRISGPG